MAIDRSHEPRTAPRAGGSAMKEGRSPALAALATELWDTWMEAEPEEATTLGLASAAPRLRDPSREAEAAMARRCEGFLRSLDAIEAGEDLGAQDRLDAWAVRAHAGERVQAAARAHAATSLEALPYAIMMLAHAAAHAHAADARRVIGARIAALPELVSAARRSLASGLAEGRPVSTSVLAVVAAQLDAAGGDLRAIVATAFESAPEDPGRRAAGEAAERAVVPIAALADFLRTSVAKGPRAADVVPLGEAEYDRRLAAWWSLPDRSALAKRARGELERARHDMIELAAEVAAKLPGAPSRVATFADAKVVLDLTMVAREPSGEAVLAAYEREIERATAFCREHGTFAIPEVCHCAVVRSPELWRRFSPCTNWPAPLLGGDEPGACAVLADPALHPRVNVPGLAVHEAVPGHFLQSRAWQLRFGRERAPVRFLGVPDECGVVSGTWIPHFSIEGWAVFAEARMEEAGFFEVEHRMFAAFCRAIHAARGLADMGVHTEGWTREETGAFLAESTGMPVGMCTAQAVRYARSGLQAWGYLLGKLAIEDLQRSEKARLGAGYDELAFQARLLDAGPVPPALLGVDGSRP